MLNTQGWRGPWRSPVFSLCVDFSSLVCVLHTLALASTWAFSPASSPQRVCWVHLDLLVELMLAQLACSNQGSKFGYYRLTSFVPHLPGVTIFHCLLSSVLQTVTPYLLLFVSVLVVSSRKGNPVLVPSFQSEVEHTLKSYRK
jgi:hypothetical protein